MKKLLVMSDTHGHIANIAAALKRVEDFDIIVHLGDNARDAEHIRKMTHKPIYSVRGNCDFYASAGDELDLHIEGVRILCVHGHKQAVKSSLLRLSLLAGEKQADLVLFGHTHQPRELQSRGVSGFILAASANRAVCALLSAGDAGQRHDSHQNGASMEFL